MIVQPVRKGLLLLLTLVWWAGVQSLATAQTVSIDDAARAVVHIIAQRCTFDCQPTGEGSGTIIHPSGIILTAWHVTVENPDEPTAWRYADDFLIEVTENIRFAPQPHYRAELIAFDVEMDLALLRIYQDTVTNLPVSVATKVDLPVLPISDEVPVDDQLRIFGYPPAGGRSIKYPPVNISGFDSDGAIITVQDTLSEGYSGGPALLLQEDGYKIAGIVIRARGRRLEVGLIRNISQLHDLTWLPNAQRVWMDDVDVAIAEADAGAELAIHANVNAIDFAGREDEDKGHLLAYLFDDDHQPWPYGNASRSSNNQPALTAALETERFVTAGHSLTITVPLAALNAAGTDLQLRLVFWDRKEARALWEGKQWFTPDIPIALTPAPTWTMTPVSTDTSMPTVTPTPPATDTTTPTNTAVPTAANTPTSLPTNTATATVTATETETPTATFTLLPIATDTATATPTADIAATQTALALGTVAQAATLTAQAPSPTATPTLRPTLLPTATVAPTNTPAPTPTFTVAVVPTPTATLTTVPATGSCPTGSTVTRISPTESTLQGRVTFAWSTNITLVPPQRYELVLWKVGEDPMSNGFNPGGGASTETSLTVNLDDAAQDPNLSSRLASEQDYQWGVLLVELPDGAYRRICHLGGSFAFRLQLSSSGGGNSGGGTSAPTPAPP